MRRGLILGKFAPFHRGHSHLVASGAAKMDELVVVVYETSWYHVPAPERAGWIRTLHPAVSVVILADLDPSTYDETTITSAHARQLTAELGAFTHVFTSESYGDELAAALSAEHISVDPLRTRVPVSSTMIRADPFAHRGLLDPLVYRSLVRKVVFLGAESTGKTTLARELARRHGTTWVPEYGRELWEAQNGHLTFDDLERIGRVQLERENNQILDANRVVFCDTNAVTTEQWSHRLFGRASAELSRLARESAHGYCTFLCEADFGWEQDGTRETPAAQAQFQAAIRRDLEKRTVSYTSLEGALDERIRTVEAALGLDIPNVFARASEAVS